MRQLGSSGFTFLCVTVQVKISEQRFCKIDYYAVQGGSVDKIYLCCKTAVMFAEQ